MMAVSLLRDKWSPSRCHIFAKKRKPSRLTIWQIYLKWILTQLNRNRQDQLFGNKRQDKYKGLSSYIIIHETKPNRKEATRLKTMDGDDLFGLTHMLIAFLLMLLWACSPPDPASSSSVDGQSDDSSSSTSSYTSTRSQFQDEPEVASVEPDYKLEAVVIDIDKVAEIAESCAECVICFESLSLDLEQGGGSHSGSGVKILGECGHRYHAVCINQWLTKHRDCPLCRRYVPRRSRCWPSILFG